jgi:hypothetical protein
MAMIVTIPYAGMQYNDIGLLTNEASFGIGAAQSSAVQPSVVQQIRNNPVNWNDPTVATTAEPQWTAMLGPTDLIGPGRVAGKSTLTATAVGPPVNVGVSATVYTYRVVDVGCVDGGALGGASFVSDANGGHYLRETDPSASDLYVTGPACGGKFNDSSGYTVHVPHGGMLTNLDGKPIDKANNGFFTVSPSVWKSNFTQLGEAQFDALLRPCSTSSTPRICFTPLNDILLFKTSAGNVVKMYIALERHTVTSGRNVTGAFEVSSGGSFPF